jgi:hypothetical protein
MAKRLMEMGFSFICANCTKMHTGIMRGEQHCGYALRGRVCGGPISGEAFQQYEGPLTKQTIAEVCFRCGADATELIEVKGKGFVGACEQHIGMLKTMKPVVPRAGKTA